MSGNEFGERIHNFFGQEGLSQYQHQSQVVDGSWSGFSNNLVGNQRQSLIDNLKSYSTQQQSDSHPTRSDYSRSLPQEHQQPKNGYMHGNLAFQGSPNVFGVDAEPSRDKLSETGFTPDFRKNSMRFEMGESPVNYDFFGGQQQFNSQPFPRQQMTFNDMQLLKQQVMVKQMHEYQMQQQLQKQQLDARQLNSLNSNSIGDNQSHPLISGTPLQDASSFRWQPDLMTGNTNWTHRGISPAVQGSSTGLMVTPEQGQANLFAQQFQPSLHGVPVGGANTPEHAFSSVQMNRLSTQHGSENMSSSVTNQPTLFLNQSDLQGGHMLPQSTSSEKLFSHTSVPGSNNIPGFESLQQDSSHERNIVVPENRNTLQKATALDPTEEKILFGSDDNLWDAFGDSITGNLMSGSSDQACPSLQSGKWSALMLSAVAETSSDGSGVQSVWATNNTGPPADSHIGNVVALNESVSGDSTRTTVQHLEDKGNKVSDYGLPIAQHNQMAGDMFHSSNPGIDVQNKLGIWKAASPNVADPMQRASYVSRRDDPGSMQQHLDDNYVEKAIPQQKFRDSSQILESYAHANVTQITPRDLSMFPDGKEPHSPSRSEGLVRDGINHEESTNDMFHFGQTVSQSFANKNHAAPAGADSQQISPQIAPPMYNLYGTFWNGLVPPVNDTGRFTPSKIEEQYSNVGNSVDGLHSVKPSEQLNTADPSFVVHMPKISGSTPGAEISSSELLPQVATDKPKKRKTATSELLAWNKEVEQGSHRLKTLGEAEVDWAKATTRFPEKVEFETSLEDVPLIRSKKRLIYATKLMQQLLCPPPGRVISLVASSNYEFIVYTAARAALGDACSSTSSDKSERFLTPNNSNLLSERTKTEKISDQYISKAAEDFVSRTKKLETDFARLENGTTISDLSVEVQDLEKFAVINRFASFHQSSTDRTSSSHRLHPQRYVSVAPMPRNIPDRVQCLSF